jgi:hypothetical protein
VNNKLTPAQLIIVIAGAVALIASFLDWVDERGFSANAWDEGAFPTYTWIAVFGVVMALAVVLPVFANVKLPDNVMGFTWPQLHLALGFFAALLAVSFLITDTADKAIGFWLSLLASIALLVGAVMLQREPATGTATSTGDVPPPPPPPA